MAGHSQWKNIQHRKNAQDLKKGKVFTKIIKEITVSVKESGVDPSSNPRLRAAMLNARAVNMPKDKIEKAIEKATGGTDNTNEANYEGFGPGGCALFVECATDNNTRTIANIRSYFNKNGGSLGKDGCLQYVFARKAVFQLTVPEKGFDVDEFSLEMIDFGAEEFDLDQGLLTVIGSMEDFSKMQKALEEKKYQVNEAGLQRIPLDYKQLSLEDFQKTQKLIDKLEEDDDVQKVYHNIEMSDEIAEYMKSQV